MYIKKIPLLFLPLLIAACQAHYSPPYAEQVKMDYLSKANDVDRYLAKADSCSSVAYRLAQSSADLLWSDISSDYSIAEKRTLRYSDAEMSMAEERLQIAIPYHIHSLFAIAETAAEHKCNKIAKNAYSQVINNYIGYRYAGYRDRAMVGLNQLK